MFCFINHLLPESQFCFVHPDLCRPPPYNFYPHNQQLCFLLSSESIDYRFLLFNTCLITCWFLSWCLSLDLLFTVILPFVWCQKVQIWATECSMEKVWWTSNNQQPSNHTPQNTLLSVPTYWLNGAIIEQKRPPRHAVAKVSYWNVTFLMKKYINFSFFFSLKIHSEVSWRSSILGQFPHGL